MSQPGLNLEIQEDFDSDPGHARIRLVGVTNVQGKMGFSLKRLMGEPPYLGAGGWQFDRCHLEPQAVLTEGDVVLLVGPEVVDHLAFNTPIELELPDLGLKGEANWPDIAPSPGGPGIGTVLRYSDDPPPAPPTAPPPAPPTASPAAPPTNPPAATPGQSPVSSPATSPGSSPATYKAARARDEHE